MAKSPIYVFDTKISGYSGKKFSSRKIAIVVSPAKTLADLAYVILAAYNFGGDYLFEFNRPKTAEERKSSKKIISLPGFQDGALSEGPLYSYYLPDPREDDFLSERKPFSAKSVFEAKLTQMEDKLRSGLTFLYDFGDNWEFQVFLDEIQTDDSINRRAYPKVLEGTGLNLIEDTGGYDYFLEEFENDEDLQFDLTFANKVIKNDVSVLKSVYEEPEMFAAEADDFFGFGDISETDLNQATLEMFKELLEDKETRQEIRKVLATYDD